MKKQQDYKYKGPDVPKKKKKTYDDHLKSGRIKVAEAASIKMMALTGATKSEIGKIFKRSSNSVQNVLENFDKYLPDDPSLKEKIETQIEQISDEILLRSKAIVDKADEITYDRLDNSEVSPLEATKISEIYLNRFAQIIGENRLKSVTSSPNANQVNIYVNPPSQNGDKLQPEHKTVHSVEPTDGQED